ncbi:MAG: TolC family protein, partial [Deltaproteobacteria bacterium]|nr:TolC family protein [Deltaproteobacteria bacterium]
MRFRYLSGLLSGAVFSLLILLPCGSLAQEKKIYTLEASIAEALAGNWTLKAKKETINQAVQVKRQAATEFLPKLSATYGYT